jgi:hypothetical protein
MSKALVIGNGESRKEIDINLYRPEHIIIGCNALHRDFTVDHLICCDRRMAEEAVNNPEISNTLVYVRPSWFRYYRKIKKNKNIREVPIIPYTGESKKDQPDHWGSGGYAVLLAACLGFKEITLIGFDLYPIAEKVNNIYKGTLNYSKSDSPAVDPSFWIYQIGSIFKNYPDINFIIKNNRNWKMPDEWRKNNVSVVAL